MIILKLCIEKQNYIVWFRKCDSHRERYGKVRQLTGSETVIGEM